MIAMLRIAMFACVLGVGLARAEKPPVFIGADLEISDITSTADDAILLGMETAIEEINARGGVLGGRKLVLHTTDNRGIPARGLDNAIAMADKPDLVAMMVGKFSAIAMEQRSLIEERGLPMLDPWAAADVITEHGDKPNYAFRLSLTDSWAMQVLLKHARSRGLTKVGILAPANVWGRSCIAAIERDLALNKGVVVSVQSYYWGGEKSLAKHYHAMRAAGANVVVLVANESDGALFIRDVAAQPEHERLPVVSHWGVLTGRFIELAGDALSKVDLVTVTTRNIHPPRNEAARKLARAGMTYFKVDDPAKIISISGLANAYDLTHLLARAIDQAGSTNRAKIRAALERLPPHEGAIKRYEPAFTPERHEALSAADVMLIRFVNGRWVPLGR